MFHGRINSPTRSVGENNIAFFSGPFCKCYTSVFLPVPHGLTENGPLAAWKEFKFDSFSMRAKEHKAPVRARPAARFSSQLTAEVPADHVRDDAVRPHSLGSRGGCSPPPMEPPQACCSLTPDALPGGGAGNCNSWNRH